MFQIIGSNSREDFVVIAELASKIWHEHYTPIIGVEQVEYMLNKFQSLDSMKNQVKNGYNYYLLVHKNKNIGYFSFIPKNDSLFLSKIYVAKESRGKGFGKIAMDFVNSKAEELNLSNISLTVNKYNSNSISVYEKMGFKNIDSVITNIGGGYVMDDFVMEKKIS